jgi:putative transposase
VLRDTNLVARYPSPHHPHASDRTSLLSLTGHPSCRATLNTVFPLIALIWADSAYQGLKEWLLKTLGWQLTISKHWRTGLRHIWGTPDQPPPEIPRGFHVLKRRWVVERTFAWIGRNRRMSRDFERLIQTSEMLLYAAMTRITLRRLANKQQKIA